MKHLIAAGSGAKPALVIYYFRWPPQYLVNTIRVGAFKRLTLANVAGHGVVVFAGLPSYGEDRRLLRD